MKTVVVWLLLLLTPAAAETLGEQTGANAVLGRPPVAADLLAEIHQFDLFEGGAADSVDSRGDTALRRYAVAQSARADKRDDQIDALAKKLGVKLSDEPGTVTNNRLAGLQGKVGSAFIASYREAQKAGYESAIAVLQRYLDKPDNADVRAFAAKQLPEFKSGLREAQKIAPPAGGAK